VLSNNPLNISFRRTLTDNHWQLWLQLVHRLMQVQLSVEKDIFVWGLTRSGVYIVKSLYLDLLNDNIKYLKKYIYGK
jgi:hypothetical protein